MITKYNRIIIVYVGLCCLFLGATAFYTNTSHTTINELAVTSNDDNSLITQQRAEQIVLSEANKYNIDRVDYAEIVSMYKPNNQWYVTFMPKELTNGGDVTFIVDESTEHIVDIIYGY